MPTIIIGMTVAAAVIFASVKMVRDKLNGKSSCNCSDCDYSSACRNKNKNKRKR